MKAGVVLLGGVIAAGKSTLAGSLVTRHHFVRVSTGGFLEKRAQAKGLTSTRRILQRMGDELDVDTDGEWVVDRIEAALQKEPSAKRFLLDSARRDFQIRRVRDRWPGQVAYVHLTVPIEIARARYDARRADSRDSDELVTFDEAKKSATEQHAETLITMADLVLDTEKLQPEAAASMVAAQIHKVLGQCA